MHTSQGMMDEVNEAIKHLKKMEFSFNTEKLVPKEALSMEDEYIANAYALGLHVPGFWHVLEDEYIANLYRIKT